MRYELKQEFPYSLATVLKARTLRYEKIQDQPGLNAQELLSVEHDGPVVITRRRFRLGQAIPDIVKKMVPEKMLEMIDTNYFNTESHLSKFTMHSEYAPEKVKITAVCPYLAVSPSLTKREYEVKVDVSVPLIASALAKAIAESHRNALIKDYEILLSICESLEGGD
ncbi:MAG TPA: DUF2505 domain-containing protein [Turneriella sp.]|nr:DUF2505 domain-containing protein [Turneriella sp.]